MPDIFCLNISRPLRLINCEPILPELLAFLGRWPFKIDESGSEEQAVITLTGLGDGRYALQSPWLEEERQTGWGVLETANLTKILCSLAVDLAQACLGESDIFGLHGAAVECAGRLLIFPNRNRAGKSLLAGALMAEGFRVYGDDLIGLTGDGQGRSFGFPIRLRLPWPELPPGTERFFQARLAWADRHYCFIRGQETEQALFGQQCPIGALIVLERQKRPGPAELLPLGPDQGLQALADRYLLRPGQAAEALALAQKTLHRCPAWLLRYSSLEAALSLLAESFASEEAPGFQTGQRRPLAKDAVRPSAVPDGLPAEALPRSGGREASSPSEPADLEGSTFLSPNLYVRAPKATLFQEGQSSFLVPPDGHGIFQLNQLGLIVWRMAAEALSPAEAGRLLSQVFPDTPFRQIASDVQRLFDDLIEKGLFIRNGFQ